MENFTNDMKTWASNNQPATPEELEKLKMLTEDVDSVFKQRRIDEAEHWAKVPEQKSEESEQKASAGCMVAAILILLSVGALLTLGVWKTIEIISSWI